jgi:Rrf2 family protein
MIYSRSTEYAIRALIPLAQAPGGRYTMVKTIAEQENIPAHFLAKILQQLARKGLLRSSKGPQGGFVLNVPAEEIRLLDIVEALDGLETFHLPAGGPESYPDGLYCTMHEEWVELKNEILDYLKGNTVADLARSLEAKQKLLARRSRRHATAKRN